MTNAFRLNRRVVLAGLGAGLLAAGTTSNAFAADTTLDRVLNSGSVRIGIANERPYGYVETDGSVSGAIPDIVRAALAPHGVTDIKAEVVEFNALIPGLNADRFDIIAAGMYILPARCQAIAFTNPVTRAGNGIAALVGNPKGVHSVADVVAKSDIIIGTQTGSSQVEILINAGVPQNRTVLFASASEALAGLRAGRVDVIYFPGLELGALLATANDPSIERVTPFEQILKDDGTPQYGYAGFGVRQSDDTLREFLDKEIARLLESNEMLGIISKYGYGPDELPSADIIANDLCAA